MIKMLALYFWQLVVTASLQHFWRENIELDFVDLGHPNRPALALMISGANPVAAL